MPIDPSEKSSSMSYLTSRLGSMSDDEQMQSRLGRGKKRKSWLELFCCIRSKTGVVVTHTTLPAEKPAVVNWLYRRFSNQPRSSETVPMIGSEAE